MTRLAKIDELFHEALALPARERDAFLRRACDEDALRREVQDMLAFQEQAFSYFDELGHKLRAESALPTEDSWENATLGPYRLKKELGRGGMGVVYLGERTEAGFSQLVAIKVIRSGRDSADTQRRFLEERRILSQLRHDGIARLYDGGETPSGSPFLVMEFVEGAPLDAYVKLHALDLHARLALFLHVCAAIQYAHANLVVHRDLKPGNILVSSAGIPKIVDFGIAKLLETKPGGGLTQDRQLPLTPDYAAPEQLAAQPVTTQTDIWGLGAVLFELLTGERPFQQGLNRTPDTPAPLPSKRVATKLPPDLDAICRKALELRPEDRYASADQLALDVRRWLDGYPVFARTHTLRYVVSRFVRRYRTPVLVASLFACLLLILGSFLAIQSARWRRERDKAQRVSALLVDLFNDVDPDEARQREIPAREVFDRGVSRVREQLKNQPETRSELLAVMARVYHKLGRFDTAIGLFRSSLEGNLSPADRATRLQALGQALHDHGQYAPAASSFREALALRRAHRDPLTAQSCTYLALALFRQGDLTSAEPLFREALQLSNQNPGAPQDRADTLTGLAVLSFAQGEYGAAEPLLREALTLQKQAFGHEHRQIADTLSNLASVVSRAGRENESEPLAREAIRILRKVRPKHPKLATALNNLGLMVAAQGREREAEPMLTESLALRRAVLPDGHPDIAQSLSNLGWLLTSLRQFPAAKPLLLEALEIRRKVFGPQHVLTADALGNLGMLYLEQGDLPQAAPLLEEAHSISKAKLGPTHPVVATHRNNRAVLLSNRRDPRAEPEFRETLAVRRKTMPPGHPHLAWSLLGLGAELIAQGRSADAEPFLREAVDIRARTLPPNHSGLAEARFLLARAQGQTPLRPAALTALLRPAAKR